MNVLFYWHVYQKIGFVKLNPCFVRTCHIMHMHVILCICMQRLGFFSICIQDLDFFHLYSLSSWIPVFMFLDFLTAMIHDHRYRKAFSQLCTALPDLSTVFNTLIVPAAYSVWLLWSINAEAPILFQWNFRKVPFLSINRRLSVLPLRLASCHSKRE